MLKSLLYTMLPTCKIYLDEDDADEDDEVEAQVEQASALLVFLTIEYVGARKGMLELTTARRLPVSYTHLRAHETKANLVCRLLLEKKKLQ